MIVQFWRTVSKGNMLCSHLYEGACWAAFYTWSSQLADKVMGAFLLVPFCFLWRSYCLKKRPCVTTAFDFSSNYNLMSWLRRQISVWEMQCHDGTWRGLAHPRQGWHNLNFLYSYTILKCIKCPKSHAVFLTIINSDHCGIQLLFLSVPILLAVEKGSWGIC